MLEYALRPVEDREDATDVVAETFLVDLLAHAEGLGCARLGLPLVPAKMRKQRERGVPPPPD